MIDKNVFARSSYPCSQHVSDHCRCRDNGPVIWIRCGVKDTDGGFYKAHGLFIAGNLFICSRDSLTFTTRNDAFQSREENTDLSLISMKKVQFIEVISRPDDSGPALGAWQPSLKDYIGDYTVNAAGSWVPVAARSGGYLYGTIRFPEWAGARRIPQICKAH